MSHPYHGLNELRELFLKFFETKGHLRLPSFSLVPQNDKSILLINAGMTPMKPWFKGEEEPPRRRVCTCQKCIRTGDIENVGKTARHGTYFEMLGNFSFGDYFKHEAIAWSWEFLTSPEWVGLEADRLYPSVYESDDEAWNIWHDEIGIPAEKIFRFGKEDNFWEHGSGPCGPCSEIYYDRGPEYGCGKPGCTVGCDCDRYIEIWNNVFSQFDNDGHNNYTELKQKNIDTGMGLERLACVCQNVDSLFDVDTVMNITHKVSELTGAHYGESYKRDVSLRVITDHIRSATFMICDGILPSNEGRGYVLRRLLRRAARHGKLLGVNEPFLYQVVDTVVHENECQYPDLREKQSYITKVIRTEEENFARTIDGGMRIYGEMLAAHKEKGETVFSGSDAFKLYDTFGFPIDLTVEMAAEEGMTVDETAFQTLMTEQKERAREARKAMGDLGWAGVEFGKDMPATVFAGYEYDKLDDANVLAIVTDGQLVEEIVSGMDAIVVLDQTPFYAEMGGQVADHGVITADGVEFVVTDVQKNKGGKYMHYGKLTEGSLKVGDVVTTAVDPVRRAAIMRAHTATHLLDKALRTVLGDHVHQAGSLVEPDRLRFDFTHFSALTAEELAQVSAMVNEAVLEGYDVVTEELPIEQAKKKGAIALFGDREASGIVLLKDYDSYYFGYDEGEKSVPGYTDLIDELTEKFPLGQPIMGEENQKDFIRLYGKILRLKNILSTFDRFSGNELLSDRQFQDYQSVYLDLYQEYRPKNDGDKENINDDIEFEMELIRQVEINIDIILMLVAQYHQSNCEDKEVLGAIDRAIDSSIQLRSKKELIHGFINTINAETVVERDWQNFVHEQKEKDLDEIISAERLKPEEAKKFIDNSGTVR